MSLRAQKIAILVICPLFCGLMLAMPDSGVRKATEFLRKRQSRDSSLATAVALSRVGLFEKSIAGFMSQPITGIGFGLPSSRIQYEQKSANLNSLSLSTEKGVLYASVLEETGLVGAGILIYLVHWLLGPIIRMRALGAFNVVVVFLIVNFGEAIFFSFGAIGLWCWLVISVERAQCQPVMESAP